MALDASQFFVKDASDIASPALLVWPNRVSRNIARMVAQVGGDRVRLRPHVKTHKMAEVVRMQWNAGIVKCKCATIAEAEMAAAAGASDVLFAYQPIGPNVERLAQLSRRFRQVSFSALVDDSGTLARLSHFYVGHEQSLRLFVDVDCGMGRTGIAVGRAAELCREVERAAGVEFAGLHIYDGHLHDPALEDRRNGFETAFAPIRALIDEVSPPVAVGGGSPTFGLHAELRTWECSPGTTLFWDAGYGENFPDLDYEFAAAVLTRVISKPGRGRLCLDLGHKSIASENPLERRVKFPALGDYVQFIGHSEEHLVIGTPRADEFAVGDHLVGLPVHICPTVALHMEAVLISDDGETTGERWKVAARDRRITV